MSNDIVVKKNWHFYHNFTIVLDILAWQMILFAVGNSSELNFPDLWTQFPWYLFKTFSTFLRPPWLQPIWTVLKLVYYVEITFSMQIKFSEHKTVRWPIGHELKMKRIHKLPPVENLNVADSLEQFLSIYVTMLSLIITIPVHKPVKIYRSFEQMSPATN